MAEECHITDRDFQEEGHMEKASKGVAWVCLVSTLLMGCYSHTTLSAECPQSAYEVSFRLKDGTFVLSNTYERVENGYRVSGKHIGQTAPTESEFSGILLDSQIREVVTNEFSAGMTVAGIVLGVGVVALIAVVVISTSDLNIGFSIP